jgi:hypothetical protein
MKIFKKKEDADKNDFIYSHFSLSLSLSLHIYTQIIHSLVVFFKIAMQRF